MTSEEFWSDEEGFKRLGLEIYRPEGDPNWIIDMVEDLYDPEQKTKDDLCLKHLSEYYDHPDTEEEVYMETVDTREINND